MLRLSQGWFFWWIFVSLWVQASSNRQQKHFIWSSFLTPESGEPASNKFLELSKTDNLTIEATLLSDCSQAERAGRIWTSLRLCVYKCKVQHHECLQAETVQKSLRRRAFYLQVWPFRTAIHTSAFRPVVNKLAALNMGNKSQASDVPLSSVSDLSCVVILDCEGWSFFLWRLQVCWWVSDS